MVRRNKAIFAAISGIVAALVLGLGLSLYLFIKERRALHLEKMAVQRAVNAEKQQALLREQAEKGLEIERRMRIVGQLGDKFNQAGMLLSQGAFDKAEKLMKDVPLLVPGSSSIFNVIGDQHGRHREWAAAITNFTRSVEVNPTNHLGYHGLAPLLIVTGQNDAYRGLCRQILFHFGSTRDPAVAEKMGKDCLILPPPQASLQTVATMADIAMSAGPSNSDWPYYQFLKGFAEYRQNHFAAAVEPLTSVIAQGGEPTRTAEAYCVLAMAQQQQNEHQMAQATLATARDFDRDRLENYQGPNWNDRIIARVLLQEAGALIEPQPGTATQAK